MSKFFGFYFAVEFKPEHLNVVADTLSRKDTEPGTAFAITAHRFMLFDELRQAMLMEPELSALSQHSEMGEFADPWSLVNNIVCFHRCAHVPATSTLHSTILAVVHDGPHEGIQKTLHRLQ